MYKSLLLIIFTLNTFSVFANDLLIVADGGTTQFGFYPLDPAKYPAYIEYKWRNTKLTVKVENAIPGVSVHGKVKHPYGGGDFTVQDEAGHIIENVSVSTFQDRIHFSFDFISATSSELTNLFSIKPVPANNAINDRLNRPGEFTGPPPAPLEMIELIAKDQQNNPVPVIPKVNSIIHYTDASESLRIYPIGFEDEVVFIGIFSINGSQFYPVIAMHKEVESFRYPTPTSPLAGVSSLNSGISIYEVRLANGMTFIVPGENTANGKIVRPPASIQHWELF